jgi:hypothetical protein
MKPQVVVSLLLLLPATCQPGRAATVHFEINDAGGRPLPCRIHIKDQAGQSVRVASYPVWDDHFVCDGRAEVSLDVGEYRFQIERGPEYVPYTGTLRIAEDAATGAQETVRITLKRFSNLRDQGWYSGDLHIHRPIQHVNFG